MTPIIGTPPKENVAFVFRIVRYGLIRKKDKTLIYEADDLDKVLAVELGWKKNGCETIRVAIIEDAPHFGPRPGGVPEGAALMNAPGRSLFY